MSTLSTELSSDGRVHWGPKFHLAPTSSRAIIRAVSDSDGPALVRIRTGYHFHHLSFQILDFALYEDGHGAQHSPRYLFFLINFFAKSVRVVYSRLNIL